MTDAPLFTIEDVWLCHAAASNAYQMIPKIAPVGSKDTTVHDAMTEMYGQEMAQWQSLAGRIQQWIDQQALLVDSGTSRQALLEQRHLVAPLFGESAKPVSHPMPHRYVIDETDLTEG